MVDGRSKIYSINFPPMEMDEIINIKRAREFARSFFFVFLERWRDFAVELGGKSNLHASMLL